MARLVVKSDGFRNQVIELHLGLNRLGRGPQNDFQIEHASISASHCEVVLGSNEVTVRDCDSTNGTFVDGEPVTEAQLHAGEILNLGDVELLVQSTDVTIAIPKIEKPPRTAPPVVLTDGSLLCPGHRLQGPALIDSRDTTIWIPDGVHALVDSYRTITLEMQG